MTKLERVTGGRREVVELSIVAIKWWAESPRDGRMWLQKQEPYGITYDTKEDARITLELKGFRKVS